MARDAVARQEDPIEGLRTVHLIEEAIIQRGLRQLKDLLRDPEGRRLLDDITVNAVGSVHELEEILREWTAQREGAPARPAAIPQPDRAELLRSFVELKESEAVVLRRAARAAPEALQPRLEDLAEQAEDHAERLKGIRA